MKDWLTIYWISVVSVGILSVIGLMRYIRNVNKKRTRNLKRSRYSAPIPTQSPVQDSAGDFKDDGVDNINLRFSIINRSLVGSLIVVFVILLLLPLAGNIPTTAISIFAASFAVMLGIISRPFIENYISGILISFNRPFQIGDTVTINGSYGTIEDITMTSTVVKQWDWRRYIVPNAKMLNTEFVNHTRSDRYIWAKVEFWVAYDAPLDKVRLLAKDIAMSSKYFANYEAPSFWVMVLDQRAYQCWIAAWADSPSKAWELQSEIRFQLTKRMQEEGIRTHNHIINSHEELR